MIHLAVWDPAIYKVRLKSKNGYAFLRKSKNKRNNGCQSRLFNDNFIFFHTCFYLIQAVQQSNGLL